MPPIIQNYVRVIDKVSHVVGRAALYLIFVMVAVLFYSAITKTFFRPSLWTFEFAQFLMVTYFLVGGAYSMQLEGHVRMDLLYSRWSPRTQCWIDSFTILFLIFYLVMLLFGAISSTTYAIEYSERSYSAWRPYMWPIKIVMTLGIILMLLQAIARWFKDIAILRGRPIS